MSVSAGDARWRRKTRPRLFVGEKKRPESKAGRRKKTARVPLKLSIMSVGNSIRVPAKKRKRDRGTECSVTTHCLG